jgi:hypothetical protein
LVINLFFASLVYVVRFIEVAPWCFLVQQLRVDERVCLPRERRLNGATAQ